jgi:hypothetical protein
MNEILFYLQESKSNTYRDFGRNLLIFVAKLCAKFDLENIFTIMESQKVGSSIDLFYKLLSHINDVEEFVYKKLVIQQYSLILVKLNLSFDTVKAFAISLVISLDQFYKMSNLFLSEKESTEVNDVNAAIIKSTFKLKNFKTPVSFIFLKIIYT